MIRETIFVILAFVAATNSGSASPVELKPETRAAWQDYVQATDVRMNARLNAGKTFLWVEEAGTRKQQVRRGDIIVAPVVGDGTQSVPNGLIHHWIGAVFIPDTTLRTLLAVVDDYDSYKKIYKPVVVDSRSLSSNSAEREFSMVWLRHVLFVNAAMAGRYRTHQVVVDEHRTYSIVDATRIQQIEDYGHPEEHLLPPDTGSGFIWRMHTIARFQETDGGVYMEIEAIALSRDIPSSVKWLVTPVVNHLSINSLKTTLRQTREAVRAQEATPARLAKR